MLLLLLLSLVRARLLPDSTLGLYEVFWQSELTQIYIGSPSLLRLPNGDLIASSDRFGDGFTGQPKNVSIHRSTDNGVNWAFDSWVLGHEDSSLFYKGASDTPSNEIYLLGTTSDDPSPLKISRSTDGGHTWQGRVLQNGTDTTTLYSTGPTPTVSFKGRIYRAVEIWHDPYSFSDFDAVVISADATSDLLNSSNWVFSHPLPFNLSWIPTNWPPLSEPGYLEGNMVIGPDGALYNVLRFNSDPLSNKAVILSYDHASLSLSFVKIIDLPGGHTKFAIRQDPQTKLFLTFSNNCTNPEINPDQRNILTLVSSPDLYTWTIRATLLRDDTGFTSTDSIAFTGFQYVDWLFEGPNILYLVRASYRGANTYHNSNRMAFKVLQNYTNLLK